VVRLRDEALDYILLTVSWRVDHEVYACLERETDCVDRSLGDRVDRSFWCHFDRLNDSVNFTYKMHVIVPTHRREGGR
jgi:hypothetical protein